MILFEIHQYRAGSWQLDSVFDNEELAVHEAERVATSGRAQAIRVVEVYDKANPARNRVVYRAGEVELRREGGKKAEPYITVGQIVLLTVVGLAALGVWVYLQLT